MAALTHVLNYLPGVYPKKVSRWIDPDNQTVENDHWEGIWTDAVKMQLALDAVTWGPGSTVPTAQQVIDAVPAYETWLAKETSEAPARAVERQLRTDQKLIADVALQAQAQGKSVDEIIVETVAKI
tara:strand:+ start:205 stop:582 length:378 start_codon:yes stop_codon:yes gene_type:complete